jgi:lactate dehydrogenase-like 2-hydroxyacid dehydrogenase
VAKILTPPQPAPVLDIARELLPPGMELIVVDPTKPEFYDKAGEAEYYLGSPRTGIGNEFFRAAPKLRLVQLTSAGYDRVDIEAARAELVKLQFFAGFSVEEAAEALGISRSSAYRQWAYARAWLLAEIYDSEGAEES